MSSTSSYVEPCNACVSAHKKLTVVARDEWFRETDERRAYECGICKFVVLEGAIQCGNGACGVLLCAFCRQRTFSNGQRFTNKCPFCRTEVPFIDLRSDAYLVPLQANCPKCSWRGRADMIMSHLFSCATLKLPCRFHGSTGTFDGREASCSSEIRFKTEMSHEVSCHGRYCDEKSFSPCEECHCLLKDLFFVTPTRCVDYSDPQMAIVPVDRAKGRWLCATCALDKCQGPLFNARHQLYAISEAEQQSIDWSRTHVKVNLMYVMAASDRVHTAQLQASLQLRPPRILRHWSAVESLKKPLELFDALKTAWMEGVGLCRMWEFDRSMGEMRARHHSHCTFPFQWTSKKRYAGKEFWFTPVDVSAPLQGYNEIAVERIFPIKYGRYEASRYTIPGHWKGTNLTQVNRENQFVQQVARDVDLARNVGNEARQAYKKRRLNSNLITVSVADNVDVGEGENKRVEHRLLTLTAEVKLHVHYSSRWLALTVKVHEVDNLLQEYPHLVMRFAFSVRTPVTALLKQRARHVSHVFSSLDKPGLNCWGLGGQNGMVNSKNEFPSGVFFYPFPHENDWVSAKRDGDNLATVHPDIDRKAVEEHDFNSQPTEMYDEKLLQGGVLMAPYAAQDGNERTLRIAIPEGAQAMFDLMVSGHILKKNVLEGKSDGDGKFKFEFISSDETPSVFLTLSLGVCDNTRAENHFNYSPTNADLVTPWPLERAGRWSPTALPRMMPLTSEQEKQAAESRRYMDGIEHELPHPHPTSALHKYLKKHEHKIYHWRLGIDEHWKHHLIEGRSGYIHLSSRQRVV